MTTQMPASGRAQLQLGTAKGLHVINTGKFVQVSRALQGSQEDLQAGA